MFKFITLLIIGVAAVSINLDTEVLLKLDRERRWITRSQAINKALSYLLTQPNTIRGLCGADKLPPEYQVE